MEVDLRGGSFRNIRSPEYLLVHGLPPDAANESHEAWVARIHPDDRERVVSHFRSTVCGLALDYEIEYRIVRPSDGEIRWILAKAEIERDPSGDARRLVGAHIDITARRTAEEQKELIARELSHRIANIFSVVNSIIAMSARNEPSAAGFAGELGGRIAALHRAHNLVLNPTAHAPTDSLATLINRVMAPYTVGTDFKNFNIDGGDKIEIGAGTATAIGLIVHELATNAVKYGSFSQAGGRVNVSIKRDSNQTVLVWEEQGGPPVEVPPTRKGFGSVLVDRTARAQLGATLEFDWRSSGLRLTAVMPTSRLAI